MNKLPLRFTLIVPFILQIVGTVTLVAYLSQRNCEKAIENLATQLMTEINHNVEHHLDSYLSQPQKVVETSITAIETGLLDWKDFEKLGHYFWHHFKNNNFKYINLGTVENEYIGVGYFNHKLEIAELSTPKLDKLHFYTLDEQGNPSELIRIYENDNPLDADWFTETIDKKQEGWSSIYNRADNPTQISISFNAPVYSKNQQLIGVLGVDIGLEQINHFLKTMPVGKSGTIFIIDGSGKLIGTSENSATYKIVQGKAQQILASESENNLIKAASQKLLSEPLNSKSLHRFQLNQDKYWLQVLNYHDEYGLDWLVVTVIPWSDFRAEIDQNNALTVAIIFLASFLSIIIGILTAKRIARPISRLNQAAKHLALGEWNYSLSKSKIEEIGELCQSFETMAQQLKTSLDHLQDSQNKLNSFLENVPIGVSIFNAEGQVLLVNQVGKEILGKGNMPELASEDLSPIYNIYIAETDQLYPTEKPLIMRGLQGEKVQIKDIEIHREDGVTIPLEVRTIPIFDEPEKLKYLISVFADIRERKAAEKLKNQYKIELEKQIQERTYALQESEEKFRRFFEDSAAGTAIISLDLRFIKVNNALCTILGYSATELQGMSVADITHCNSYKSQFEAFQKLLKGEIPYFHLEKRCLPKNKNEMWSLISISLVRNSEGHPLYFIGQAQDISDRKRMEIDLAKAKEAAEAANIAKSTFLAKMSHELRTPLNAILGFSQLMKLSQMLSQENQENVSLIYKNGEYLLTLINNILDLSKLETQNVQLIKQDFDLFKLIEDIKGLLMPKIAEKGLKLSVNYGHDISQYIHTDEIKLRQILINLLSNSIKFTDQGNIVLDINQKIDNNEPYLQFSVTDTGIGIAEDEINTLFHPFQQTTQGKAMTEGSGLGLAISRQYVQLMGGKIQVSSQVNVGSCFSFEIPVKIVEIPDLVDNQPTQTIIALQPNQPTYRILVVDDDESNGKLLIKWLQKVGFEPKQANSGENALEICQHWLPHLIWMNLNMPGIGGYEATRHIKECYQADSPIIIALTASLEEKDKMEVIAADFDDLVSKPYQESQIFTKMAQYLGVRYLYADVNHFNTDPLTSFSPESPNLILYLEKMPQKWREKLYQAAIDLEDGVILELIAEIPTEYGELAQTLSQFVYNFRLNRIRILLEPITP